MVDQDEIEKHDVSVDRNGMSNLVNDQDFLTQVFERYGLGQQQGSSARQPSGNTAANRQGPQKDDGAPPTPR